MKAKLAFLGFIAAVCAVVIIFSCDNTGDPRGGARQDLGEPDLLFTYKYSTFDSEIWVYPRRDLNVVYEFRRTTGACGGSAQWYLYTTDYAYDPYGYGYYSYTLYDMPPTIVHQPILSAPVDHPLTISAQVTLSKLVTHPPKGVVPQDKEITGVMLLYRAVGDSVATQVGMTKESVGDSVYTAQIPVEMMTPAGVEYCILASSNADLSVSYHWSHVPEIRNTYFRIECTPENIPAKKAETMVIGGMPFTPDLLPEPGDWTSSISPISQ